MNFPAVIRHKGRKFPLRLRYNSKAKRIILRVDQEHDGALITLPPGASEAEAFTLAQENSDWLIDRLEALPPKKMFADGQVLTFMGENITICHRYELPIGVKLVGSELFVSGNKKHLPMQILEWLRNCTRDVITPRALDMASRIGQKLNRVSVRDTKSRWGSCSVNGNLSFCWRLIMTPEWVLNYVIAHEVSHLLHMNHGPEFWSTVRSLDADPIHAKKWLNQHGVSLQRIGI